VEQTEPRGTQGRAPIAAGEVVLRQGKAGESVAVGKGEDEGVSGGAVLAGSVSPASFPRASLPAAY